ncbi:glycoside hydrolase family 2 protein [Shewanella submarina]|uniref:Beta-mannosidase B n=1 Tax=Shewanella submarina TaxID=2016376 RepID=A0ABV7G8G6_9GAMM|nr:glycoside hydrolase family 2 protein [Shewanella submarina]MCL1036805.1 glycoside hydrolase family 2 protein [Shewanella submarina]
MTRIIRDRAEQGTSVNRSMIRRQTLCGDWLFSRQDEVDWLPARVPGCNYTDLMAAGVIPDPFYRDNEQKVQWVAEKNWVYRKAFILDKALFDKPAIQLVADGLDTFCEIFVNGQPLGNTRNMFLGYRFDCKALLRPGENEIELVFRSPLTTTRPFVEAAGFVYPAENDKSDDKLSVYCRKAPCQFGWDWGPRLVSSGIWRDIYLEGHELGRIADVQYVQHALNPRLAEFAFKLDTELAVDLPGEDCLMLQCWENPELDREVSFTAGARAQIELVMEDPELWWPNGAGDPFLYHFELRWYRGNRLVDSHEIAIGLRTIEVINRPDGDGESFLFRVNGRDLFMKGANYIPADAFPHRVGKQEYLASFDAALDANMNMLRVWGGGIYQDDEFYRLADEKGILIWQDFMFACSLYPADREFLSNVRAEAEYNIKRLRNHACIALWCGNNEVEMAIEHWQWPEKFDYGPELYERLKADYLKLFDQCLPRALQELDPGRFYLRSSPIGYWENEEFGKANHHYWGVWHGEQAFSEYRRCVPRFMSEFGFQSFPILDSVSQYTQAGDHQLASPVMVNHQKHPRGNQLILSYLAEDYPEARDFESLLYLSQVQQAEGLRQGFEAHRGNTPFCMGSLYWQFNDTWPGASWSGIDYFGRYKALHYQARRSFASELVFAELSGDEMSIKGVSDGRETFWGKLCVSLINFDGDLLWQQSSRISLAAGRARELMTLNPWQLWPELQPRNNLLVMTLVNDEGEIKAENQFYFVKPKHQMLKPADIQVTPILRYGELTVRLASDTLARQVYLSLPGLVGNFSDNFFDLLPGRSKEVSFKLAGADRDAMLEEVENLSCRTLQTSVIWPEDRE